MNIRVDLNTPIKDGTEVVFRSPVDCSQVTGLIVYYDGGTASQEFMLADAHGNNVGDIDHLFAENVAVKVILDVTTGMAFVQNADTNAYLEGRFAALAKAIANAQPGGSGGTTIHFVDWLPGEVDPSDVNTKYKVGDLFFVTNEAEAGFYELTAFDTESDPGLVFPVWELKYSFVDDEGYENQQDGDAPTANQRVYFRGEYRNSMLSGYGPMLVTYEGSLYFTDGNFVEGGFPDTDEGWIKLTGTGGTGFVWRGEYDENESYSKGNAVSYNGSSYICTYDNTPTAPDDNGADWELLAKKGYTPVKGADYWTDADKAEIKAYVDDAILGGAW